MIFGTSNPQKILHQYLIDLPTSPVCCSHFVLGKSKKSFFNKLFECIICKYVRFVTLTVIVNLPITPEKYHHNTLWTAEIIHLMEGILFPSERWWLWKQPVVVCGNVNVRQATSQQVFKVTTFCIVVHQALLKIIPRLNKLLPQVVCIADCYLVFTRSCSMPQMQ